MRPVTIARNYAEALAELAGAAGALEAWGELVDSTAAAFSTPTVEAVLMSPRVTREQKVRIITQALDGAPHRFVLFLVAMVKRGRALLLGQVADEYRALVDLRMNRVRAGVTTARPVDEAARQAIVARLTAAIEKEVIAGFTVEPSLLGGVVVRIGDRIYDGSVRKKLGTLRRKLLAR